MPIKAVVTDMDGTLLNPEHVISQYTVDVIQRLKAKGIAFIVCTGRPYPDVLARIRKCGLDPDYIITSNGARVHDRARKMIISHNMEPAVAERLVRVVKQPNSDGEISDASGDKQFITNIYREAEWLSDKRMEKAVIAFDECFPCTDLGEHVRHMTQDELQGVHEMWFLGQHEDLVPLEIYLAREFAGVVACAYSLPYILDCVPAHVSKGRAVREVSAMLGFDLSEVACFGDGMNDESMLQIAGKSYIMSNAQPALIERVKRAEMIGSNAEDGVAKKLEELFPQ